MDEDLAQIFCWVDEFRKGAGMHGLVVEIGVQDGRVAILLGLLARDTEAVVFRSEAAGKPPQAGAYSRL